jgi:DNA-binding response OmpR family regulator
MSPEERTTRRPFASGDGDEGRGALVLLVEDDAIARELMASELQHAGFVVRQAADGEEGLDEARRFRPDVIVLDLMLPKVNGFSLVRAVRTLEHGPRAVVAVSGLASEALRSEALAAGCDAFLPKPVHVDSMIAYLKRVAEH